MSAEEPAKVADEAGAAADGAGAGGGAAASASAADGKGAEGEVEGGLSAEEAKDDLPPADIKVRGRW